MTRASRLRPSEILEDSRGDAHARGGQRGADEHASERGRIGQQPRGGAPAEHRRSDGAERRDEKGRASDLDHLVDRRLEADLEQQQNRADARQQIDGRVGLEIVETGEAHEREVPQQDARSQLSKHGRLAGTDREMSACFRRDQNQRQRKDERRKRVAVHEARMLW